MSTTAQQVTEATGKTVRKVQIEDRAVFCRLKRKSFGSTKKIQVARVEVDMDKKLLKASKKLLDSQEFDDIRKIDQEITAYVKANALPSMIDKGLHLVPLISVEQHDKDLTALSVRRELAVDKLAAALSAVIEQDRASLRGVFNESDYPEPDKLSKSFAMDWSYMALTAPRSLEAVSEELYMTARAKMEANIEEASEAVRMVLRAQFKGLVEHLVERLTPTADGKKKRVFDSMSEKLNGFLETFSARNITEDEELSRLVQDAKDLVAGIEPENLRTDDAVRDNLRVSFEVIKEELSTMVTDAPIRRIMLDEEEE